VGRPDGGGQAAVSRLWHGRCLAQLLMCESTGSRLEACMAAKGTARGSAVCRVDVVLGSLVYDNLGIQPPLIGREVPYMCRAGMQDNQSLSPPDLPPDRGHSSLQAARGRWSLSTPAAAWPLSGFAGAPAPTTSPAPAQMVSLASRRLSRFGGNRKRGKLVWGSRPALTDQLAAVVATSPSCDCSLGRLRGGGRTPRELGNSLKSSRPQRPRAVSCELASGLRLGRLFAVCWIASHRNVAR